MLCLNKSNQMSRRNVQYFISKAGVSAGFGSHIHPHMLRHGCGFYLEKGYDLRVIQDYLGHRDLQKTVIYTRTAAIRFQGLFS